MKTKYVLGSLDQKLYLIVKCKAGETACWFETTDDDACATRFDAYTLALFRLAQLEAEHPLCVALNVVPLPIVNGEVAHHPTLNL